MIIFGIDASTKSTGYSVFDGKKLMEYGVIKSNKEILIRILEISNQLESLFDKYNPEIVYIEDVPLSSAVNRRVAEYLLLLQGCILRICLLHNINFIQLEPSNWRRLVGLNSSRKREEQKAPSPAPPAVCVLGRVHYFVRAQQPAKRPADPAGGKGARPVAPHPKNPRQPRHSSVPGDGRVPPADH